MVVIDLDNKTVILSDAINYDRDLQYGTENGVRRDAGFGVSESDPNMWVEAIHVLFGRLAGSFPGIGEIRAVSVSGQQHGLVTLTTDGELSRPYSKLWNDFSTGEECALLTESIGGMQAMIGEISNTQRTGYTAAKIFHMVRHEPDAFANTATVFLVHNYINWILTDGKDGGIAAMEPGDVSGSAIWDPSKRDWATSVIDAISPDLQAKLPPVKPSREMLGPIGAEFVSKYGFSSSCMVASGSGDNMMGAIGTGNYREGVVTVSLGTSGTAYSFMKTPYVDPEGEIASFCDATGNYLPLLCISNLANGYEAALKQFGLDHASFEDTISRTEPGNRGRLLCPWYEGERTPDLPEAAPVYFGFELGDFTEEILCRAVLEGHVMNLYEGFVKLPVKAAEIRLTGGMSKSRVWREAIANIFNCEVVPVLGEGAALGAALHAAWSWSETAPIEEIADPFVQVDEGRRFVPDPTVVGIYNRFKEEYMAVSQRIRGAVKEGSPNPFKIFKGFN